MMINSRILVVLVAIVLTTSPPPVYAFSSFTVAFSSSSTKSSSSAAKTTQLNVGAVETCPLEHIILDEYTQRDMQTFSQWAFDNCGVQKSDGFDLQTQDGGQDYFAVTRTPISQGLPVLFIPEGMIISSSKVAQEFDGLINNAQQQLVESNMQHLMPLFLVFVKILVEYQKGLESPYYPWLNSLPRLYNTGASMTFACFDCLPDYASSLALQERKQSVAFQKAAQFLSPIFGCRGSVMNDVDALKWAYNVAVTRSIEVNENGERMISPMADMFNHGSAETEVQVSYDDQGNCVVYATRDIPAGSQLRMSYGDPTNPSRLFATYGFLDESSPASFCKVMHLQKEMEELGYDYSRLLFYKDTGDISMEVYDVVLYDILKKNDPNQAQAFQQCVLRQDGNMKQQYHGQYFPYTKEALQKHVDSFLTIIERFAQKATSYDPSTHPRVPVILKHNSFVKETFMRVKQNLDNM